MLDVLLLTPEKVLFAGQARSVILPGEEGVFELNPYHKPLLSRLVNGRIIINHNEAFHVRRGLVGLNLDRVSIIVEE